MGKPVNRDRLKWLSDELTELCGEGVIGEATRRRILENYFAEPLEAESESHAQPQPLLPEKPEEAQVFSKAGKQNYFLLVLVLLGALLIGGGVVFVS